MNVTRNGRTEGPLYLRNQCRRRLLRGFSSFFEV